MFPINVTRRAQTPSAKALSVHDLKRRKSAPARLSTTPTPPSAPALPAPFDEALPLAPRSWRRESKDAWRALVPPDVRFRDLMRGHVQRASTFARLQKQPHTFTHNGLVWLDPTKFDDTQLRLHYATVMRLRGVHAGFLEADALANALRMQISMWRVYRTRAGLHCVFLARLGEATESPEIRVSFTGDSHYRALIPAVGENAPWSEEEGGGHGDCLFFAVRRALLARGADPADVTAAKLRDKAANQLASDAGYNERVRTVFQQAACEHALPNPMVAAFRRWFRVRA